MEVLISFFALKKNTNTYRQFENIGISNIGQNPISLNGNGNNMCNSMHYAINSSMLPVFILETKSELCLFNNFFFVLKFFIK